MTSADIIQSLDAKFGPKIKAKKLDAIDPFIVGRSGRPGRGLPLSRDEPALKFEMLNCISGVDYFEPDAEKGSEGGV